MVITKGKFLGVAFESVHKYDEVHQDIFWYLLEMTDVYRCVCRESLREFLIRYLLISEQPLDKTAVEFIDEGVLIAGAIGENAFEFKVKDLFNFLGFSTTSAPYHINGDLSAFLDSYKKKYDLITHEPISENNTKVSKDAMIILLIGANTLLKIDSLNLRFRENLEQVSHDELERIKKFVDYVLEAVPNTPFENYKNQYGGFLKEAQLYYIKDEKVEFNPLKELSKEILVEIFEKMFGADDLDVKEYRENEIPDEEVDLLRYYAKYIRFAYGVKHGLIKIDDNWMTPMLHNYAPNYIDDPIEEFSGEDGEVLSTEYIYKSYNMDEWIHLLP